jgi:hypothetical protein
MSRKLPEKLNILGIDYTICYTDNITKEIQPYLSDKEKADEYVGYFVSSISTIFVSKKLPIQNLTSTLIHEVLEAISYHLELNIVHKDLKRLESALYQIITANNLL